MQSNPARHRVSHRLLALVLGLAATLPAPSFATTARLVDGESPPAAVVNRWALDARVDEHPADRPMVLRASQAVWRFEARLAAIQAIAAQQLAAEQAAAEQAAAEAAAATAAAQKAAAARAAAQKAAAAKATAPAYAGKNRLWIPTLGMSRSVADFACTRSTPPANQVYRWGCAGANNVYLFGHAWGVMKPLHDGYLKGKVRKGMVVVYADGKGGIHRYKVTEIRVVTPDQTDWAIAAQSKSSMTLQTCLGANSEQRLLVRLVESG
ncbi:MAG: sortase [Chloroflexi bacterium]|nr:sortase [Chloroflexota bacterium]